MYEYVVYGAEGCDYCTKATALLKERGLTYRYVDVRSDPRTFYWFKSTGLKTVPQVYKGELLIGGYSQLEEWLGNDTNTM